MATRGQFIYPPSTGSGSIGQPMDPNDVSSAMASRMADEMRNNAISAGAYGTNAQIAQSPWMPANGDLSRSPIMPMLSPHIGEPPQAFSGLSGVAH